MKQKQAERFLNEALKQAQESGLINKHMVKWVLKSVKRAKANQEFMEMKNGKTKNN